MKILDDLAQDESSDQLVLLHPVKLPHGKKITGTNTPQKQSCALHHHHVLTCTATHQLRETLIVIMLLVDSKMHEVRNIYTFSSAGNPAMALIDGSDSPLP
jgi:hypothetical protein